MATTSQVRAWWAAYECTTAKYSRVAFPGVDRVWNLYVATPSVPVWEAAAQIMASEPYLFRESAGGTYNCRPIAGSTAMSIHAFALAIDINPSKNPHQIPLKTDMPASFIRRMEGIRANGKQALTWGGRFAKPDAMHFQINVAPADCKNVTWDEGDDMALTDDDLAKIRALIVEVLGGDRITTPTVDGVAGKPANAGVVNSVWHSVAYGRKFMDTMEETHDAAVKAAEPAAGGLVPHTHDEGATGPAVAT